MGVEARETPSLTGEFIVETHRVLEHAQAHTPGNQHQKGPICLWVVGEVTESWQRAEQAALFPLRPFSHIQHYNTAMWVAPPRQIPKAPPLICKRRTKTKNMAQVKEQIKAPEKIQLSDEEIASYQMQNSKHW